MDGNSFKYKRSRFLNFLNPQPRVGSIEFNDSYVRFVMVEGEKVEFYSLNLAPGVIEEGKIKDRAQFLETLKKLKQQIGRKNVSVIVSVSDSNVYADIFNLPFLTEENLEEAARLNLQMISPIDFANAYSDWHKVGERGVNSATQIEALGAFVSRQFIDDMEAIMAEAGFIVIAVEFFALALARTIMELGEGISKTGVYLIVRVGGDGISFSLVKNGNLYFVHYVSWGSAYGEKRQVDFESFKNVVVVETQRVLGFVETHLSGSRVEYILIVSSGLSNQLSKIIAENFPSFKAIIPTLKLFKNFSADWFCVLGSALRGIMPRSQDTVISLASSGTELKFKYYRIFHFIRLWKNAVFTVLIFVLAGFIGLDLIAADKLDKLKEQAAAFNLNTEAIRVAELQKEARDFNKKADLVYAAFKERSNSSSFTEIIREIVSNRVVVDRIVLPAAGAPVLLNGSAASADEVIKFKQLLENDSRFSDVNLPLANIRPGSDGRTQFSMTFIIKGF